MASIVAAQIAAPSFVGLRAQASQKAAVQQSAVFVRAAPRAALNAESLKKVGQALVATGASLLLVGGANAATVKMGADDGGLVFQPASITVSAGEKITWTNNAGFPHNIVFDEDAVPSGVKADSISHEDYFNGPGESFSVTLTEKGDYEYYCEPHQGAGMNGKIKVQ